MAVSSKGISVCSISVRPRLWDPCQTYGVLASIADNVISHCDCSWYLSCEPYMGAGGDINIYLFTLQWDMFVPVAAMTYYQKLDA